MRGLPNFNFPAFRFAAAVLRSRGFEVFSPAEHDVKQNGKDIENNPTGNEELANKKHGFSIRAALKADTFWICDQAEAVALLPGWENSSGARAERALAEALGLTIIILGKEFIQ